MALSLTMAPADIQVVLDAIAELRGEMRQSFSSHDNRLRLLEQARAASDAVSVDRHDRRMTTAVSRRWFVGLVITAGLAALSAVIGLLNVLTHAGAVR